MEQIQDVLKVAAKAYKLLMENEKVRVLDIRLDLKAGQTLWLEAGSHTTENIGTTEGHNLVVEIKK